MMNKLLFLSFSGVFLASSAWGVVTYEQFGAEGGAARPQGRHGRSRGAGDLGLRRGHEGDGVSGRCEAPHGQGRRLRHDRQPGGVEVRLAQPRHRGEPLERAPGGDPSRNHRLGHMGINAIGCGTFRCGLRRGLPVSPDGRGRSEECDDDKRQARPSEPEHLHVPQCEGGEMSMRGRPAPAIART